MRCRDCNWARRRTSLRRSTEEGVEVETVVFPLESIRKVSSLGFIFGFMCVRAKHHHHHHEHIVSSHSKHRKSANYNCSQDVSEMS